MTDRIALGFRNQNIRKRLLKERTLGLKRCIDVGKSAKLRTLTWRTENREREERRERESAAWCALEIGGCTVQNPDPARCISRTADWESTCVDLRWMAKRSKMFVDLLPNWFKFIRKLSTCESYLTQPVFNENTENCLVSYNYTNKYFLSRSMRLFRPWISFLL